MPSCFCHQSPCHHPTSLWNIFCDNMGFPPQVLNFCGGGGGSSQVKALQVEEEEGGKLYENNNSNQSKVNNKTRGKTKSWCGVWGWCGFRKNPTQRNYKRRGFVIILMAIKVTGVDKVSPRRKIYFLSCFVLNWLEQNSPFLKFFKKFLNVLSSLGPHL